MKYQLWWVPARISMCMNWQPEMIGEFNTYGEALEAMYCDRMDEPAPDKDAYMYWHIEPITTRG